RDKLVTGVQTCALPISADALERAVLRPRRVRRHRRAEVRDVVAHPLLRFGVPPDELLLLAPGLARGIGGGAIVDDPPVCRPDERSEERRVGKGWRVRGS